MTLPLAEVGTISAAVPELSTLPALWPVAEGQAQQQGPQQQQQADVTAEAAAAENQGQPARDSQQSQNGGQLESAPMPAEGQEDLDGPETLLVAEMDDATGLPLCLLPQAYGQQELVAGPYTEVRRAAGPSKILLPCARRRLQLLHSALLAEKRLGISPTMTISRDLR